MPRDNAHATELIAWATTYDVNGFSVSVADCQGSHLVMPAVSKTANFQVTDLLVHLSYSIAWNRLRQPEW